MSEHPPHEAIDGARVGAWLAANVAGATPPFLYRLITGGRSNLTFAVTDAASRRFVLRRPPMGPILATAHNVAREYRLVKALGGTPVPVPRALAVCEDPAVNGTPFAVTAFVDGIVLDLDDPAAALDDAGRRELAFHLVDVLADLHAVDLNEVGLADLSRRDGYIERQLRRWSRQWADSPTHESPLIDEVELRLRERVPVQRETTLVHGDYRFGNCIVDVASRRVAAVLDWELCTLGDPLADLGHLGVYWHDPAQAVPLTNDPTSAGGFPSFDDLLQRYAARTGRDVTHIEYYRAFAAWRLAIIAEGIASRHLHAHPDDAPALAASHAAVEHLADFARSALDRLGV